MLKKYRIIIILFIILCMILIVIKGDVIKQRIVNILDYRIEKDSIFKDFNEHTVDFIAVATLIKNYDKTSEETIFIEKINKTYIVKVSSYIGQKEIQIADSNVKKSIKRIFNSLHYKYIYEDGGNGIYFTRR